MALKLYAGYPGNKNANKARIVAEYSGVKISMVENFEMGVTNKTPEFLKMNPIGKIPVLETPEGAVFESNAIARYVAKLKADNPLFGSTTIEYGQIEQWIDFSSLEIDAPLLSYFKARMGWTPYFPAVEEATLADLKRGLGALNTHLASNTYVVGDSITLADIVVACNLYLGFARLLPKTFTSEFPHVERYFWTLVNQPNFKKILGDVKQTDSFPPIESAKKPGQQKEKAKPKEAPKKEAKKEEPAKPVDAAAEEEAPKPKAKNPLDLLPPSKMILDDWKRLYSNTKSNFRERMDLARKYAFGKMLIIGGQPPFKVKGLWLFRGQEIPQFIIDECYDMELYEWKKVDITDEAQKERASQMIEDFEPFEGEPLLDAKCFK
ncbi:unnamed protein product [Linum tenue]|uniref:Elongation factor 1-gamma n=1 Tax=Linum tenue TaxID=586396 RepID=A0AAV0GR41_9ROSI|nr:unnamed protein product [Linum tenue]